MDSSRQRNQSLSLGSSGSSLSELWKNPLDDVAFLEYKILFSTRSLRMSYLLSYLGRRRRCQLFRKLNMPPKSMKLDWTPAYKNNPWPVMTGRWDGHDPDSFEKNTGELAGGLFWISLVDPTRTAFTWDPVARGIL